MPEDEPSQLLPQTLLGWLEKAAPFAFRWLTEKIRIKEIKKHLDPDVEDIQDFFERTFSEDGERIDSTDLVSWLTQKEDRALPRSDLQQCLLVGKHRGRVIALMKAIYCPVTRHVFLAYLGVNSEEHLVRKVASKMMVRFFQKFIRRKWKKCAGIVYEVARPKSSKKLRKKCDAQIAKARLFRELARRQGLHTYRIGIDYVQPHMAYAPDYVSEHLPMNLMFVPLEHQPHEHLSQADCRNILWLICHRVYGSTQSMTAQKKDAYLMYLDQLLNSMSANVGDSVPLIDG